MPTSKERILVTLTPDMARDIKAMAKREKTPKATVAARLMRQALEDGENQYLGALSDKRLAETTQWLSQEDFWKKVEGHRAKRRKGA